MLPTLLRIFQIWTTPAGYEELAKLFEQITNGEIFWMNNDVRYQLFVISTNR